MTVHEPLPIRLLTHNIRYATNSPFKGEEKWGVRKSRLINELSFNTAHCRILHMFTGSTAPAVG